MTRRALVTGATGLAGSYLVERLAADGWAVRALVRDPAPAAWLASLGAELAAGDVLDAASVARAAAGCAAVLHAAAAVTPRGGYEAFRRPNVDGTANAVAAAEGAGARLVHLSSVAVYGAARHATGGAAVSEDTPLAPLGEAEYYARSKRESEQLVIDAHRAGRLWATAIRPCVIYGRRDRQFVPRLARAFSRGGVAPAVGAGPRRFAVVHAANVADAAVRALATDAAGGRAYITANDGELSYARFVELAAEGLARPVRVVRLPRGAVSGTAAVLRAVCLAAGRPGAAAMLRASVDFLGRDNPFTSERARRELAWRPPVTPEDGVRDAFAWWRASRA